MTLALSRQLKEFFQKQKGILCVYLFGSTAKGKARIDSDVDLAILFEEHLTKKEIYRKQIALMGQLNILLKREVDIVVLNQATPFMRYHVLREGKKIFEAKDRREYSFETRSLVEYFDFLPIKQRLDKAMMQHLHKG